MRQITVIFSANRSNEQRILHKLFSYPQRTLPKETNRRYFWFALRQVAVILVTNRRYFWFALRQIAVILETNRR